MGVDCYMVGIDCKPIGTMLCAKKKKSPNTFYHKNLKAVQGKKAESVP